MPDAAVVVDDQLPNPALLHLLGPKWLTARARALSGERGRGARFTILALLGLGFWGFIFGMLYRMLVYFRNATDIGALLAGKLLGLMLVSFMSILLLSNIITALSSFFLARETSRLRRDVVRECSSSGPSASCSGDSCF